MNTPKNDGGPAFPGFAGINGYGLSKPVVSPNGQGLFENYAPGMSTRLWLAGQALPSVLSKITNEDLKTYTPSQMRHMVGMGCLMIADAIIEA